MTNFLQSWENIEKNSRNPNKNLRFWDSKVVKSCVTFREQWKFKKSAWENANILWNIKSKKIVIPGSFSSWLTLIWSES